MSENSKKFGSAEKILAQKIFHYEGTLIPFTFIIIKFDYKVKIVGTKQMIRIGDWTEYIIFDCEIFNVEPKTNAEIFLTNKEFVNEHVGRILRNEIESILSFFSLNQFPVLINDIKIMDKLQPITESSSQKRGVVRDVIKDVISVFKKGEGEYSLPEDINGETEYEFHNIQTPFSVEVRIIETDTVDGFDVDGGYYDDDDTFEIDIHYNPQFFPKLFYELIGELNEVFRHELQHLIQNERGMLRPTDDLPAHQYYTQPHEIDAQIQGFRRISKLRKIPFEKVVRQWYYSKDSLTDEQKEKIINIILNSYKKTT